MPYPEQSINWAPREPNRPPVEHQYRLHRWSHDRNGGFWYCATGCGANIFGYEAMMVAGKCGLRFTSDTEATMDMCYFLNNECRDDGTCP